jgi:hypothetical protein
VTLADFRAMSLHQLNTWLEGTDDELNAMVSRAEELAQLRRMAYKILKEKMAR